MATVTGFTAAHMQALANANIVGAALSGENLILTKRDGTQVNVGKVKVTTSDMSPVVEAAINNSATVLASITAAAGPAADKAIAERKLQSYVTGIPDDAVGGFSGENGRGTDLLVNKDGEVISDTLRRWAQRLVANHGVVGGLLNSTWYGGGFAGENGRMTELTVDNEGNVLKDILDRWASRMTLPTPPIDVNSFMAGPDLCFVGDSLTAAGQIAAKVAALTGRTTRNLGVGGETTVGIAARLGVYPFMIDPVTIPPTGSVDVTFKSSYDGMTAWPLLQGSGVREGDQYLWGTVAGVRVRLSIRVKDPVNNYPYHGDADIYQITRATDGPEVIMKRKEPFLPEYGMARSGDIITAWMGQNGPNDAMTFAAFQAMEQWITKAGARFLFMTKPTGDNTGWTDFEKQMRDRWGRRYMNVRRFLIDDALPMMGLTPTEQDLADIGIGRVPTTLRTDSVHHTAAAQQAIGEFLVYPRMKELRYL